MSAALQILLKVFAIAGKARLLLSIWPLIKNGPKIYRYGKKSGAVIASLLRDRRLPMGIETREFLRETAELARSGIIDLPNVDEEKWAEELEELAAAFEEVA